MSSMFIAQISMSASFENQILQSTKHCILVIVAAHAMTQRAITSAHANLDGEGMVKVTKGVSPYSPHMQ